MSHDRILGTSPFPGDDGLADPQVRRDLAAVHPEQPTSYLTAIATLCEARLLVPIAATATAEAAVHAPGPVEKLLTVDKEADMAVVMMKSADGRTAMLAFTGLDSQAAWDRATRPVPVTLDRVAATAEQQGATALIIDIAGPHPLVIDGEVLAQLSAGRRLVAVGEEFGWLQAADPTP